MERSRRAPRVILSARVEGLAQYGADVRVLDASPNGALLESTRFLESGSWLTLELSSDGAPISLRARVVHCARSDSDRFRVGVRFEPLPEELRDRMREFLGTSSRHERREQPRVFVGQPAQLKKELELSVLNLSLFGGLFSVRQPLEFDSEHDFVFSLPQGDVRARGVVRHCEVWAKARDAAVFRLGVEFTELCGADRDRVVAYLEEQIQAS